MQQQTPMFMPQVVINAFLLFIFIIINLLYYFYLFLLFSSYMKVLFCHDFDYFIILLSPPLTY